MLNSEQAQSKLELYPKVVLTKAGHSAQTHTNKSPLYLPWFLLVQLYVNNKLKVS